MGHNVSTCQYSMMNTQVKHKAVLNVEELWGAERKE